VWLVWVFAQPRSVLRLVGIPIPAATLFLPLVLQQLGRGNPLGLFAEPGAPTAGGTASGWQLALAAPAEGLHGWVAVLEGGALSGLSATLLVAILLVPFGLLALLALFVPGTRRAIPAMLIALLGYLTAVGVAHIAVTHLGAEVVPVWSGAALSLFWLGLLGGVMVTLDAIRSVAAPFAVLTTLTVGALAVPLLGAVYLGLAQPRSSSDRMLPAFVTVEAGANPSVGTLVLSPVSDDGIVAGVQRGRGTTLDDQSTIDATATGLRADDARLARLAGNLASRSGYDASADLTRLGVNFVLLARQDGDDAVHERISQALDANALLTPVGNTDKGYLWRTTADAGAAAVHPGNAETPLGLAVLLGQGGVFAVTLLLGIPTVRRRRKQRAGDPLTAPATTFDEDHDA
jgi:hypothetical protein